MAATEAETATAQGFEALATGNWDAAKTGAVVNRERAYAGFRRDGGLARAARTALWLSREYALVWRHDAAANGWLARAERLLARKYDHVTLLAFCRTCRADAYAANGRVDAAEAELEAAIQGADRGRAAGPLRASGGTPRGDPGPPDAARRSEPRARGRGPRRARGGGARGGHGRARVVGRQPRSRRARG